MKKDRNQKLEEILESLDGTVKASAPDFFYTRLKARMEKGIASSGPLSWILRPAYAFTVLGVVLFINALVILKGNNSTTEAPVNNDTENLQAIAAEFNLSDNNYVYNLNPDK